MLFFDMAQGNEPYPFIENYGTLVRQRVTYIGNRDYGDAGANDQWIHSHRYSAFVDLGFSKHLSARMDVSSALASPGFDESSPIEMNALFFGEAYLGIRDLSVVEHVHVGRQQLQLGSGRLVAVRRGPNVKRRFDGALARIRAMSGTHSAFILAEVQTEPWDFDDRISSENKLNGVYSQFSSDQIGIDTYFLWTEFANRNFEQAGGRDERASLGGRAYSSTDTYAFNIEGVYQTGELLSENKTLQIEAWTLAAIGSLKAVIGETQSEYGLSVNYATGDRDQNDSQINSFNALFPRGNYFDEVALVGPTNLYNISPFLKLRTSSSSSLELKLDWFFRAETSDGVYGPPGSIIRTSSSSEERLVHTGISGVYEFGLSNHLEGGMVYSRILPGAFIRETGNAKTIDFVELTLSWTH